jgi:hypothetical protein
MKAGDGQVAAINRTFDCNRINRPSFCRPAELSRTNGPKPIDECLMIGNFDDLANTCLDLLESIRLHGGFQSQ